MPSGEIVPDTIAAIATPAGRGGIGIVRVSGPKVPAIAQAVIGRLPEARRAVHCSFRDALGERVDEGVALYFKAPLSYTGDEVLELPADLLADDLLEQVGLGLEVLARDIECERVPLAGLRREVVCDDAWELPVQRVIDAQARGELHLAVRDVLTNR